MLSYRRFTDDTIVTLYRTRPCLVGLPLYSHGRLWLLIALGRQIPAVTKDPATKCDKLTMVQQLPIKKPDNCFDRIHNVTDAQTDTADGIGRAYAWHRAAINLIIAYTVRLKKPDPL